MFTTDLRRKRREVSSSIASFEFLQTVRLVNAKVRLLKDIDKTTELAIIITRIIIKKMFMINFKVFGVVSLFTC